MTDTLTDIRPRYTQLENAAIEDYGLTPYEGWLYVVILKFANYQTREAFPSIATLAKTANMSRSQVKRSIATLEQKGLIEVKRDVAPAKGESRKQETNHYTVVPVSKSYQNQGVGSTRTGGRFYQNRGVGSTRTPNESQKELKPINETRARAGARAVQSSDTVSSSKRKKPTVEQEFRAAWNEHAAVGNALRAAFGDDFVPAENCPRANLERYLEAAQQLGAAGCKPEDVESLHTYVKRRAKTEEWSVKFGPLALARHYTDYLKARKNAEERRQQDAELVIVPVSMERQPFGPARERIAS